MNIIPEVKMLSRVRLGIQTHDAKPVKQQGIVGVCGVLTFDLIYFKKLFYAQVLSTKTVQLTKSAKYGII
jgi:hypothetical protein